MRKTKKQKLRIECDTLFKRKIIELSNGRCELCGDTFGVTAHHFFPRSLAGHLIHYLPNGVCLCRNCHFAHHIKSDPEIHELIIRQRGRKWFNSLKEKKKEKHFSFKTIDYYNKVIEKLK